MDNVLYANDWLAAEIKRINKQRKILVYEKLSDALADLNVTVSAEEEKEEEKTLANIPLLEADLFFGGHCDNALGQWLTHTPRLFIQRRSIP